MSVWNRTLYIPKKKRNDTSSDTITAFVHNVRLLSKHIGDLVTDHRIINNDIIGFTKTETNIRFYKQNNTIIEFFSILTFITMKINFQVNECRNYLAIFDKFDANGVSMFSFKKHAFPNRVFRVLM